MFINIHICVFIDRQRVGGYALVGGDGLEEFGKEVEVGLLRDQRQLQPVRHHLRFQG